MLPGWLAITAFLAYAGALVVMAGCGHGALTQPNASRLRKGVYAFSSCATLCSWSYYGALGAASRHGLDFLPVLIGPIVIFSLFSPVVVRIARIAKAQNITSIADFVAVRYGKAAPVAATVTIVAIAAVVPFVAVQLRAIGGALTIFIDGRLPMRGGSDGSGHATMALVAALLTGLTILIGTRHVHATEHQNGLMTALAGGAVIALLCTIGVSVFVCWGLNKGIADLTSKIVASRHLEAIIDAPPTLARWLPLILISMGAALVMPQQFHVSIVENRNEHDTRTLAWLLPIYVAGASAFVLPIACAGLISFPDGTLDRDFTLLALPIDAGSRQIALLALVGCFAATTATVIVATLSVAVMACNDLVVPLLLWSRSRRSRLRFVAPAVLTIRRIAIAAILLAATLVAFGFGRTTLSALSRAAIVCAVQIAPAAVGALIWSRGTARGAMGGMLAGLATCAYTMLLPSQMPNGSALVSNGPLGLDALRPTDLFGVDLAPFGHAAVWSLALNVAAFVSLSLSRQPNTSERLQANVFVRVKTMAQAASFRLRHANVSVGELLATVGRFLGERTAERLLVEHHATHNLPFDPSQAAESGVLQYAEHLIASAIGASSSRMVISLLLEQQEISRDAARRIVDDVAFEIQNSRDLLRHAMEVARDGMAVFDADLRLMAWNRAYQEMFDLPPAILRVGTPLERMIRSNVERGIYGEQDESESFVAARLEILTEPPHRLRMLNPAKGRVLELRSVRLHSGGLFFTYTDATAQAQSEEELEAENETLERRVRERTEQLVALNVELARAKAEAEDANITKSRFLAAASHDVLQPLSAARLYAASLRERLRLRSDADETLALAGNVDQSLEAVEEVMSALLEISQLDAGATKSEITSFALQPLLDQLRLHFQPLALAKGLRLAFVATTVHVRSDRRLLRRMLQNLVSNALKYTPKGKILVGVRRARGRVRIEVVDTGLGIPETKLQIIFREFERLPAGASVSPGAGLGLSIVERLSRILDHTISVRSRLQRGSTFAVTLDLGSPTGLEALASSPVLMRPGLLDGLVVAAIDDESHILAGMEALLRGWGCVVACGQDLADIELALKTRGLVPDVVVADYRIGDMDGLGVIAALRLRYGACPAVLVTADRGSELREQARAAEVRVLHKPLKPATLRSLLAQWRLVKTAAE